MDRKTTRPVSKSCRPSRHASLLSIAVAVLSALPLVSSFRAHAADQSPMRVSVVTADGSSVDANLVEISDGGVRLNIAGKEELLALEHLSEIQFDRPAPSLTPIRAQLTGGSQLSLTNILWTDQTLQITPAQQSSLSLPVQRLRWVRFRGGNPATTPAWLGLLEENKRGDRLVVRRNEKSLESIEGTVLGIGRESVKFEMGGNAIEAPLAKLEGILLSHQATESASSAITLADTSGSLWVTDSVRLAPQAQRMQIQLAGSIEHEIPLEQIREIRFAGGVLPLAEAEIASAAFASSTGNQNTGLASDLDRWFSPRSADGVISMNAPGKLTYRIPDGYQKLVIAARRSNQVQQFTALRLEVLLDGEVKWTEVMQDRDSLGLELPLAGARQLTLRVAAVDPAGDSSPVASLGGSIEWFSGRLLK